ncbi:hypothetical protein KC360_g2518 [Hortaea werneckii]|nr:hypothetical protein KC325_g7393 [Hortaea werneckii]KAI6996453.1 hypothetical protein KC359_g3488 [Hortaea werneckii]KAI7082970.1 hypothetical protein KC356_g7936 [Hortaea werneckii]KAI7177171.1 hypothetical protein KC360_g2518 [Hortaea werneckii]
MENSPFSKLAAETRNQIYELVLCPPGGIQIGLVDGIAAAVKLVHPPPEQRICSLLATCRDIREECRPMLYGANFFQVNELSLPGETFQRKEAKDVRVQRYSECMKKLQGALPLIRQVNIDANDSVYSAHGPPTDDAIAFVFVFDLRDLSTLSVTLVQQKFRAENQRLQTLRARGEMTLQEYSTEIVRLHTGRRRMIPLIAEFVAMNSEDQVRGPNVTNRFDLDDLDDPEEWQIRKWQGRVSRQKLHEVVSAVPMKA